MRSAPLPAELTCGPFSTARASELGVSHERLRRRDLVHLTRGCYSTATVDSLRERAAAYALGMPRDRAFSHITACALLGMPVPGFLAQEANDGPLHVMAPSSAGQVARDGCVGHRGLELRAVVDLGGLRVVAPEDTWCDLGELRKGRLTVEDLVVIGDSVVAAADAASDANIRSGSRTSPGVRMLHAALGARVRPRGKQLVLAPALELVRPRVRSPMESRARVMFVGAGLPEPEINGAILDGRGRIIAEGDLVWRDARVIVEYQGAYHADIAQRSADTARRHVLEDDGWMVREMYSADIYHPTRRHTTIQAVARALDSHSRNSHSRK